MNTLLKVLLASLFLLLAACGGSSGVGTPPELEDLVGSGGESNAEVELAVVNTSRPATITNQYNPEVGGLTVYEVTGTTPKGKAFKAVLLGDEGINLEDLKGKMRIKARLRQVQGQVVLAGRILPATKTGINPIAFVAGAPNVQFSGPAAGTVYELNGLANFSGTCAEDGLSGSYSFKQSGVELQGALMGLKEHGKAVACAAGAVEGNLPVALSYTAVQTHMGVIFMLQGSLATAASSSVVGQAAAAMPSTGIAVPAAPMPSSSNLITVRTKSVVKELGGTSGAELISFDETTGMLRFRSLVGNLSNLAVNDIVVSAPRTGATNGFLRKVTSIQNPTLVGDPITVRTVKANLGDMLDEANVSVDRQFSQADVQRATALQQGRVIYAASQVGPSVQALQPISRNKTLVLYDQDGDNATTDDQVTITGNIDIKPNIVIKLNCSGFLCTKPDFTGKFVLDETAKVTVSAKLKKELHESKQLARITLGAIVAGPLVFVPDIVINLDLEGVIRVEVEFSVTQNLNLEAGVKYKSGEGWTPINKVDKSFSYTGPTFEGSVEAKASLSGALRLMLYGVAGVSAEAGVYAKLEAQYPGTPAWKLTGGIEGDLGVDLDLIIVQEELDVKLFDKSWSIDQAPNTAPKFLELESKYICDDGYSARVGAVVGGGLPPITLFALTDDKEDGAGKGTIDWSSSLDGSLGRTRPADKHILSATLRNGTHTITAVLTDNGGRATTKTFTVKLSGNNCQFPAGFPDVDITSNDNAFPLVVINTDRSLTLKAKTRIGTLPTCLEITWKSNLERRNAGTSTGGQVTIPGGPLLQIICEHTFTHTYKNLSPQTITAKISYNGMTVTDSIDVGALLPLPPTLGSIQRTAPSGTRYVYVGDVVSFSASGNNPVWSSSLDADNINGRSGNAVNGRFDSVGPRTIVARIDDGSGGFSSKTLHINVLSPLAKP